jgi:hypothetical protein
LEDTLVSVLENRPANCQILVVLNQPYGDPYCLAGEVCFVEATGGAALAECVAGGIAASNAPIVHVLGCGFEATARWVEAALAQFDDPAIAAVAPVVVDRFDRRKILSAGLRYTVGGGVRRIAAGRALQDSLPQPRALCGPDILAAFYRKAALETVQPWLDRTAGSLAGADWALALRHAGYRSVVAPGCLVAAHKEVLAVSSQLDYGMAAERLFWRWIAARGWTRSLAGHAGLVALECLECLVRPAVVCRLAGRFWADLRIGAHRPHWQRLAQPLAPLPAPGAHAIRPPHFISESYRRRAAG